MKRAAVGQSGMANAMGATIKVSGPASGLYLVSARTAQLEQLIAYAGGKIAMRFAGGKVLAALPFEGFLALKADARIVRIGPVGVDPQRLKKLTEGLAGPSTAPPGRS